MTRRVRLRAWQKAALDRLLTHERKDFLAVATPGAGKTTFALTAALNHLGTSPHSRVIVVVPTQHLKHQWTGAALGFDLHLEPEWSAAGGRLPADMHGIVTTYQQVSTSAKVLRTLSSDSFVIFDEIHHAGDDRAWGEAIAHAFAPAAMRLSLSGTPFRSDTRAIPFVNYISEEAEPDFEYGYGHALVDGGVVRPIHFPRIDGHMEWTAPDGTFHSHGFEDDLDGARASQRLRTALSLEGQWMTEVLDRAHSHLTEIRRSHPQAGGLVIAMDQDHARGIATILERRLATRPVIATSDDPMASRHIARYAAGTEPWIVAVRMVSEGVDIPRLRLGVYATNTITELFFRQAIGRLVRYTKGIGRQPAYLYLPDDRRLRTKAIEIAEQRRHSLRKRVDDREEGGMPDVERTFDAANQEGEQEALPSLFSVISAVAVGDPQEIESPVGPPADSADPHDDDGDDQSGQAFTIDLSPPPVLAGAGAGAGAAGPGGTTLAAHKGDLRAANVERVREIVALSGLGHAVVNRELNKQAGIAKVTEATARQLERRLRCADAWLIRLTHR